MNMSSSDWRIDWKHTFQIPTRLGAFVAPSEHMLNFSSTAPLWCGSVQTFRRPDSVRIKLVFVNGVVVRVETMLWWYFSRQLSSLIVVLLLLATVTLDTFSHAMRVLWPWRSPSSYLLFSDNNITKITKIAIQSEGCQRSLSAHWLAAEVKK